MAVRFAPKTIGFFRYVSSMAMPNMKLVGEFVTQLEMPQAFWEFVYKMAARGHFVFPIDEKNHRVLVIWDLNGYGEYEFDRCICDKAMACKSVGVWRRNQKHNNTEIFKFRGYNNTNKLCYFVNLTPLFFTSMPSKHNEWYNAKKIHFVPQYNRMVTHKIVGSLTYTVHQNFWTHIQISLTYCE